MPSKRHLSVLLGLSTLLPSIAHAATPLFGVNLSGLEMGSGTKANYDYAVPSPTYMDGQNVAVIRLPFKIERLQPTADGAFNAAYLGYINNIVAANLKASVYTVLDPHDFGYISNDGTTREIAVDPTGTAEYLNFIQALAQSFRGVPLVAIGLMNEPHGQTCAQLTPVWQEAITAIRSTGFSGPIMVPPTAWSAALSLVSSGCAADFLTLSDPANNLVFEVHSYLDPDDSGTYAQPIASTAIGTQRLTSAIAWATQNHERLYLGETGSPPDTYSVSALDNELQTIKANPSVFWGVTLWSSGPWWPTTYAMRLDPVNGVAQPQMVDLAKYLSKPEALILTMAEDAYQGNAQYSVKLDGKAVSTSTEMLTIAGDVPDMITLPGPFFAGAHAVTVTFLNDLYGGSKSMDRNLYVLGADFDGQSFSSPTSSLLTTGSSVTVQFTAP